MYSCLLRECWDKEREANTGHLIQTKYHETCGATWYTLDDINIDGHVFMHINITFDDDDIMYSFMDTSGRQVKERWLKKPDSQH